MKITHRVLAMLGPAVVAGSLLGACGNGDTVQTVNNVTCPEPGGSFCNGSGSGVVCAEGSTKGQEFSCAQGEVCEAGACVGQCEPNATECVGERAFRACSGDGKQWVPVACQENERCEDGACVELPCSEGEVRCASGTARETCVDGAWDSSECPGQTACVDGACVGDCTVGETRCDNSTHDLLGALFGGLGGQNFTIVWTCTDGQHWEVSPCADGELCTYSGVDRAETERYRSEVASWFWQAMYFENPPEGMPTPPPIPKGATASCQKDACGEFFEANFVDDPFQFFESPVGLRMCGAASDEEGSPYEAMTQCTGLPPYAPLRLAEVNCPTGTLCAPGRPQLGCAVQECDRPGESWCDENVVVYCDSQWLYEERSACGDTTCVQAGDSASCVAPPT
jgi:hypothetical protein